MQFADTAATADAPPVAPRGYEQHHDVPSIRKFSLLADACYCDKKGYLDSTMKQRSLLHHREAKISFGLPVVQQARP